MKYKIFLSESTTLAYWISNLGEVVEVGTNHINMVIKNPKKFGYTTDQIKDVYDKYDERMGQEGKAREEIILNLVNHGWIRVRRYNNKGYSVNINKMTKKVKDILFDWADKLLNTGIKGMKEKDKYIPVNIQGFKDHFNKNVTIQDIANDILYETGETFDKSNGILILESVENLDDLECI